MGLGVLLSGVGAYMHKRLPEAHTSEPFKMAYRSSQTDVLKHDVIAK